MPKLGSKEIRKFADALSQAHLDRNRAGRALHDKVAPLLMGAGLQLQILSMDQPKAGSAVAEVLQILDQAMEGIREVSQSLAPSPAYRIGLQGALEKLVAERHAGFQGAIKLKFSATAKLEPELMALFYDAIQWALDEAMARPGSSRIAISITGTRQVSARIQDNGKRSGGGERAIPRLLAEEAGFVFSKATGKGTIVLIRHGISRPSRG